MAFSQQHLKDGKQKQKIDVCMKNENGMSAMSVIHHFLFFQKAKYIFESFVSQTDNCKLFFRLVQLFMLESWYFENLHHL